MKQILQIDEVTVTPSAQFSSKFSGAPFNVLNIDLQGHVDTAASNTLALAGSFGLIGQYELRQGQDILVSLEGPELRLLADADESQAEHLDPSTTSQNDEPFKATATLDFEKLGPMGTLIDAGLGNAECYQNGRFNAYTSGGSGWEAPNGGRAGTLRSHIESVSRIPTTGYFRPKVASSKVDLGAGPSSKRSFKFEATGATGGVLMGFLVRAYDSSGSGLAGQSSDTLVRRIVTEATTRRYKGNLSTMTWAQAKRQLAKYMGTKRDASGLLPAGFGFVPIIDDAGPASLNGGLGMASGDTIEVALDTASDVEEEFGAAAGTTAATGDQAIITPLYFERVTPTGAPSTVIAGRGAASTGVRPSNRSRGRGRGRR